MKLDLGCGKGKRSGYIGLDSALSSTADIICDFKRGIPLASGRFEAVLAHNLLEHMPDLIGFMNEIWRVMRHNAELEVTVPYYLSMGAFQDPTHVRYFTEKTFLYFTQGLPYDYGFRGRFLIKSITLIPNPDFSKEVPNVPFLLGAKYFMNAVTEMTAILVADKNYVHPS